MLKSHEKYFSSTDGKRQILVVDDEQINREILGFMLQDEYDVLYAADGEEALEMIRSHVHTLSLVLLDLMMPKLDGFHLMDILRSDDELKRIPYIVLTSEKSAEVNSLKNGASDFIVKPFDQPEVIQARIQRTIELAEDKDIIQSTERDPLTSLFNREFFYRYVEQYDMHNPNANMDALSLDINHFHMINELYGWDFGDEVLSRIGNKVREMMAESGGIAGRIDADMFLVYFPSGADYEKLQEELCKDLLAGKKSNKVKLRLGVYPNVDRTVKIERRFDRAKQAADTIRDSYTRFVAYYDASLLQKELRNERLIESLDTAIAEHQFRIYYQPKYDITEEEPRLRSAEALIRWQHPEFGMVSPGVFIPLFEEKGLIQKVDRFVWEEAARQMAAWKDKYGIEIPVSVNVSRIDVYAPDFVDNFKALVARYGLRPENYFLEITESAYTKDSEQLLGVVERVREEGFPVEMDDFGSGYSSLNMISTLPIDALKMDMNFIRNMHTRGSKNNRIIELMIDIAHYLGVPVVAEGVETQEQVELLRNMGCNIVQGYYFSKPVTPEEFETFIEKRLEQC
ncbi:MAG: EAL domain-containing protein [Firmicutes bacterium]|nr:EAL domain-containing protein [Bacillota bacterium]